MSRTQLIALIAGTIAGHRASNDMTHYPSEMVKLARLIVAEAEKQEDKANKGISERAQLDREADHHASRTNIGSLPLGVARG
jgi:hypothetical protein